jgi:DnaK suppressor protein
LLQPAGQALEGQPNKCNASGRSDFGKRLTISRFWFIFFPRQQTLSTAEGLRMSTTFKQAMKKQLLDLKEQILRQLVAESDEFQEIVDDMEPKDLADIAADDIDRRILEVLGSQEIKRLQLIDSALGRIENGHYGVCMSCGKKIPEERLKAIPYAILCIECKSSEERRNR